MCEALSPEQSVKEDRSGVIRMQTALGRKEDLLKGQRLCKFDDLDLVQMRINTQGVQTRNTTNITTWKKGTK